MTWMNSKGDIMKLFFAKIYTNHKLSTILLSAFALLLVISLAVSVSDIVKPWDQTHIKASADKEVSSTAEKSSSTPSTNASSSTPTPLPEKVCYLTFDDGPSNRTPEILDILDRYNVKATFFVVGTSKLNYLPEIVRRGNSVGLHSDSHVYSNVYASDDSYYADLNAVSAKVEQIIGYKPKLIRFPGGSDNAVSKGCPGLMTRLTQSVRQNGYQYVDWNIVANDTTASMMQNINGHRMTPAPLIIQSVIGQSYHSDGTDREQICVLMHDAEAKYSTVEALPSIIENLLSRGYALLPLDLNSPEFHAAKLNN